MDGLVTFGRVLEMAREVDYRHVLRTPAVRAVAVVVPLSLLLTSNVSAASRSVSWDAAGSQTAGDQAWMDSLTASVAQATDGSTIAADDPSLPVLPSGGDPSTLVEVPAAGSGDQPGATGLAPQVDLAGTPRAGETTVTAELAASGIPVRALKAYIAAAQLSATRDPSCHLQWSLLAGIGRVESNHGRFGGAQIRNDGTVSPRIYGPRLDGSGTMALIRDSDRGRLDADTQLDRAVGPMQFLPGTWSGYGSDADGDGNADPQDLDDAALSAARYLCAGSQDLATQAGRWSAVLRYNRSNSYAAHVISLADSYATGTVVPVTTVPAGITAPPVTLPQANKVAPSSVAAVSPTASRAGAAATATPVATTPVATTPAATTPAATTPAATNTAASTADETPSAAPTPAQTPTSTPTSTPAATATPTAASSASASPAAAVTSAPTATSTATATPTTTATSPASTAATPSDTPSPAATTSETPTPTAAPTPTATPTAAPTAAPTATATATPTATPTPSASAPPSLTVSASATPSAS